MPYDAIIRALLTLILFQEINMGQRASSTTAVTFEDVRVSKKVEFF